ncbi:hypothetical protein [Falsiroseomonas tokyonensis]|uniref:Uncharacterized protein n=1 Tax=Falsiroseomonas tokyonensis TaxID=430521 RepID=A0ABV7BU20_9PROT|nr:hypothetical protein [Falsiroseomonas tokyonensis]MBU8537573.1 hypothetical protein [Falsiroseomonas tokyonensis]
MARRPALAAILAAIFAASPALAQTPFACRLVAEAKESHLVAERFEMVVQAEPREAARTEYWMMVRNPHPFPASLQVRISLPGVVEASAEPVKVPPRRRAEVLIGWFPLDMSRGRRAPPLIEEVQAALTIPFCEVLRPEALAGPVAAASASGSAGGAVPAGRLQVVRDEGADDLGQRL